MTSFYNLSRKETNWYEGDLMYLSRQLFFELRQMLLKLENFADREIGFFPKVWLIIFIIAAINYHFSL